MKNLLNEEAKAKELLLEGSVFARIKSKFGKGVLSISGTIDRDAGKTIGESLLEELRDNELLAPFKNIVIDIHVNNI